MCHASYLVLQLIIVWFCDLCTVMYYDVDIKKVVNKFQNIWLEPQGRIHSHV